MYFNNYLSKAKAKIIIVYLKLNYVRKAFNFSI